MKTNTFTNKTTKYGQYDMSILKHTDQSNELNSAYKW